MRHHWLVRSCVAAIVVFLAAPGALAGDIALTAAVSEADGIWVAVIALAALAAAGPASGRRGR